MSFAPISTMFAPHGDGTIQGEFREKDFGKLFQFSAATEENPFTDNDFDQWVWVAQDQRRWAKVKKTVAFIVVDEGPDGTAVIEKWFIKGQRTFDNG